MLGRKRLRRLPDAAPVGLEAQHRLAVDVQHDRVAMRAAGPRQSLDEPAELLWPMVGQYEIRYPGMHGL